MGEDDIPGLVFCLFFSSIPLSAKLIMFSAFCGLNVRMD